jgi:hypothetical protein
MSQQPFHQRVRQLASLLANKKPFEKIQKQPEFFNFLE